MTRFTSFVTLHCEFLHVVFNKHEMLVLQYWLKVPLQSSNVKKNNQVVF